MHSPSTEFLSAILSCSFMSPKSSAHSSSAHINSCCLPPVKIPAVLLDDESVYPCIANLIFPGFLHLAPFNLVPNCNHILSSSLNSSVITIFLDKPLLCGLSSFFRIAYCVLVYKIAAGTAMLIDLHFPTTFSSSTKFEIPFSSISFINATSFF